MSGCKTEGMHGIFKIYKGTLYVMVTRKEKTFKIREVYGCRIGRQIVKSFSSIICLSVMDM
jgi:hypothetical protein